MDTNFDAGRYAFFGMTVFAILIVCFYVQQGCVIGTSGEFKTPSERYLIERENEQLLNKWLKQQLGESDG